MWFKLKGVEVEGRRWSRWRLRGCSLWLRGGGGGGGQG